MMKYTILPLMFVLILIVSCCSSKSMNSYDACNEFYSLNKNKDFEHLSDVYIGGGRVESVYDKSKDQYILNFNSIGVFDTLSDSYITIPFFRRSASFAEKDSLFKTVKSDTKSFLSNKLKVTSEDQLLSSYIKYVEMIYKEYDSIEIPNRYKNNVIVEGNPSVGKFITFTLNGHCNIYYVYDRNSLNEYWVSYINKLRKFSSNWYYEIIKHEAS